MDYLDGYPQKHLTYDNLCANDSLKRTDSPLWSIVTNFEYNSPLINDAEATAPTVAFAEENGLF